MTTKKPEETRREWFTSTLLTDLTFAREACLTLAQERPRTKQIVEGTNEGIVWWLGLHFLAEAELVLLGPRRKGGLLQKVAAAQKAGQIDLADLPDELLMEIATGVPKLGTLVRTFFVRHGRSSIVVAVRGWMLPNVPPLVKGDPHKAEAREVKLAADRLTKLYPAIARTILARRATKA